MRVPVAPVAAHARRVGLDGARNAGKFVRTDVAPRAAIGSAARKTALIAGLADHAAAHAAAKRNVGGSGTDAGRLIGVREGRSAVVRKRKQRWL